MRSTELTPRVFAGTLILATSLQIAESLLPRIPLFPWLRIGLSWAVLLPFLAQFGVRSCLEIFLARNVLSLVFGGLPVSSFAISSVSGVLSIGLVGGMAEWALARRWCGWMGASVLLACSFNLTQLAVATGVVIGHRGNLFQLGPILAWSLVSGALVAFVVLRLPKDLWHQVDSLAPAAPASLAAANHAVWKWILPVLTLPVIVWLKSPLGLSMVSLLALTISGRRGAKVLWVSWPFYLYLAWFHLLDTPGHLVGVLGLTHEGILAFAFHALRLAAFLLVGQILVKYLPWQKLLERRSIWAQGTALAMTAMPVVFQSSMTAARAWWKREGDVRRPFLALLSQELSTRSAASKSA